MMTLLHGEPFLEWTSQYNGGGSATSASPRLFAMENGTLPFPADAMYAVMSWDRALSYQEVASIGFRPWRYFDRPTESEDVTTLSGIGRYSDSGPDVFYGINGGAAGNITDDLPEDLDGLHSSFKNAAWMSQSSLSAAGINNSDPMIGYNPTNGPSDIRIRTDDGTSGTEPGLQLGDRMVAMHREGETTMNSTGMVAMLGADIEVGLLDIELCHLANGDVSDLESLDVEGPIGYYPWFHRHAIGKQFESQTTSIPFAGWDRPHRNIYGQCDLDDKLLSAYVDSMDGMIIPFYWDYNLETTPVNPGTNAIERVNHLLSGNTNYGGFENRVRWTRYLMSQGVDVYTAIRVDQGARYSTQEIFDAQMELCMRVGDGYPSNWKGVFIWGAIGARDRAAMFLKEWATNGQAAALYGLSTPDERSSRFKTIARLIATGVV